MKKALITGQVGAYPAEFLLGKSYKVHSIKRRTSLVGTECIYSLYQGLHELVRHFTQHYSNPTVSSILIRIVQQVRSDDIYVLGAQSQVEVRFEESEYTIESDALNALSLRNFSHGKNPRLYQASLSNFLARCRKSLRRNSRPS